MKRHGSLLFGIAVTILCLWFSFRGIHWVDLVTQFDDLSYSLIAVAAGIYLLSYVVRAFLWKELLGHDVQLGLSRLFHHLMLGVMANNVLPARLGEVVRCYLAAKDARISQARVFSTIFVERSLDVVCLFGLTTLVFIMDFNEAWPTHVAVLAFLLLLLISGFVYATIERGHAVIGYLVRFSPQRFRAGIHERLGRFVTSFLDGLPPLGWSRRNLKIVGYSLGCWAAWAGFLAVALRVFHLDVPLPGIFMLTGIINLGILVPSAPGFIGPFQLVCLKGLGLFSVPPEKALAFSIVFHASWYLPATILGALFFLNLRFQAGHAVKVTGNCDG